MRDKLNKTEQLWQYWQERALKTEAQIAQIQERLEAWRGLGKEAGEGHSKPQYRIIDLMSKKVFKKLKDLGEI